MPRKLTSGQKLVAAKARAKLKAGKVTKALEARSKAKKAKGLKRKPAPKKKKTQLSKDFDRLRLNLAERRAANIKLRTVKGTLKGEPRPVRGFVIRAVKAGRPAKIALNQGRILHKAGKITNSGKSTASSGGLVKRLFPFLR